MGKESTKEEKMKAVITTLVKSAILGNQILAEGSFSVKLLTKVQELAKINNLVLETFTTTKENGKGGYKQDYDNTHLPSESDVEKE